MIPLLHRVLLELDDVEEVSAGGIVLPRELLQKERKAVEIATVVKMGSTAFQDFGGVPDCIKVGDRVVIARYAGKEVSQDNKRFVVVNDEDILVKLGD